MSVSIPGTVDTIGTYFFYDCYNLGSATIGSGVKILEWAHGKALEYGALLFLALSRPLVLCVLMVFSGINALSSGL